MKGKEEEPGSPAISSEDEYYSEEGEEEAGFHVELPEQRLIDSTAKQAVAIPGMGNPADFYQMPVMPPNPWRVPGQLPECYFNFGMDEAKWRLYVNKQIYMRFERIVVERKLLADRENHELKKRHKRYPPYHSNSGYGRYEQPPYHQYGGRYPAQSHYRGSGRHYGQKHYGQPSEYPTFEHAKSGEKLSRF